jgi:hypothetical protein
MIDDLGYLKIVFQTNCFLGAAYAAASDTAITFGKQTSTFTKTAVSTYDAIVNNYYRYTENKQSYVVSDLDDSYKYKMKLNKCYKFFCLVD